MMMNNNNKKKQLISKILIQIKYILMILNKKKMKL